jgi:hypothetical protein
MLEAPLAPGEKKEPCKSPEPIVVIISHRLQQLLPGQPESRAQLLIKALAAQGASSLAD